MVGALKALGIQLEERWEQQEAIVVGCGGRFLMQGAELFLGNAGTAMRCAAAAVSDTVSELGLAGLCRKELTINTFSCTGGLPIFESQQASSSSVSRLAVSRAGS